VVNLVKITASLTACKILAHIKHVLAVISTQHKTAVRVVKIRHKHNVIDLLPTFKELLQSHCIQTKRNKTIASLLARNSI